MCYYLNDITVCEDKLGIEDGGITDTQITASSTWSNVVSHSTIYSRLNSQQIVGTSAGAWCSAVNDQNQWIQARVNARWVAGVMTQGRNGYSHNGGQWVTQYKVQYSNDGTTWTYVTSANQEAMVSFKINKITLLNVQDINNKIT